MRQAVALGIGAAALLVGGGVVYAASRPAAPAAGAGASSGAGSSGSAGGAGPASGGAAKPEGLTASGKTATGWALTIVIELGKSGLLYQGFFGDVVTVKLPVGCSWRTVTGTGNTPGLGPPSGSEDFVFVLVEPMTYELAYSDASRVDQMTTLSFQFGATFAAATSLASGDYVILAFAQKDLEQVVQTITTLYASTADALKQPTYAQEAATVMTASDVVGQNKMTPELLLTFVTTMGPWADKFAADVHSFVPFNLMTAGVPSWWPTDDTAASSEYHVLYRYIGPGIDVSALPMPAKAWKRIL